jgi:hypothetical protein|tara:strand:+ start:909 stop:1091 length:183 start_codon:yes stop_codon:yes gene_type:complete
MKVKRKKFRDTKEDEEIQREIKSRANFSLVILERALMRNGSGSYISLFPAKRRKKKMGLL